MADRVQFLKVAKCRSRDFSDGGGLGDKGRGEG